MVKGSGVGDLYLFEGAQAAEVKRIGLRAEALYSGRDWTELWDRVRDTWFGHQAHRVGTIGSGVGAIDSGISPQDPPGQGAGQ